MSYYFHSIGTKTAVSAALKKDTGVPQILKDALVATLAERLTPHVYDYVHVDLHGHGGSFELKVREFIPAEEPKTPVGYGDDGKGSAPPS